MEKKRDRKENVREKKRGSWVFSETESWRHKEKQLQSDRETHRQGEREQ